MKKNYPQEHRKTSNKNVKEIVGSTIAFQKKREREREISVQKEIRKLKNKIAKKKKLEKAVEQKEKNFFKFKATLRSRRQTE